MNNPEILATLGIYKTRDEDKQNKPNKRTQKTKMMNNMDSTKKTEGQPSTSEE